MENLAPLVREISWSKNVAIVEKCKAQPEREFYIYTNFDKSNIIWYNENALGKSFCSEHLVFTSSRLAYIKNILEVIKNGKNC